MDLGDLSIQPEELKVSDQFLGRGNHQGEVRRGDLRKKKVCIIIFDPVVGLFCWLLSIHRLVQELSQCYRNTTTAE